MRKMIKIFGNIFFLLNTHILIKRIEHIRMSNMRIGFVRMTCRLYTQVRYACLVNI